MQALRRLHRAVGREPQLAVGFLLQGRRRERRRRPLRLRPLLDGGHRPGQPAAQVGGERAGVRLGQQARGRFLQLAGGRVEVLAAGDPPVAEADQRGGELAPFGGDPGFEVPERRLVEGPPLLLALDDEAHRDALDAAGAEAGADLLPQHRRQRVAEQPVEDAAPFLGLHQVGVDVPGVRDGLADGFLGDLVEDDAAGRHLGLQHLLEVRADRLAFAVRVGRQQDFGRFLDRGLELADPLLLGQRDDVVRGEVAVDVDGHAAPGLVLNLLGDFARALGQVADVPDARLDPKLAAEEPRQCLGFCRRLDDDQGFRHKPPLPYHCCRRRPEGPAGHPHDPAGDLVHRQTSQQLDRRQAGRRLQTAERQRLPALERGQDRIDRLRLAGVAISCRFARRRRRGRAQRQAECGQDVLRGLDERGPVADEAVTAPCAGVRAPCRAPPSPRGPGRRRSAP